MPIAYPFGLVVHGDVLPGDSGRSYGPPELCYPPEPESVENLEIDELDCPETFVDFLDERIDSIPGVRCGSLDGLLSCVLDLFGDELAEYVLQEFDPADYD